MPIKSRFRAVIPDCSLPTFLFGSPSDPLENEKKQFLDAHNPDRSFTPTEVRLWAQRFAAGLRRAGLKPGDRVLAFSPNDLFYPIAFLGIIMAGGIFTGANPTFTTHELATQLQNSGALFLLCNDAALEVGIKAAASIGMGKERIFVFNGEHYDGKGSGQKGCQHWSTLIVSKNEGRSFIWDDLRAAGAADTTLALNYSSGTTGVPKGVEISHKNYVSNTIQMCYMVQRKADWNEQQPHYRQLCFLPLYHAMAQTVYIANSLVLELPVYIMPKFDFIQMLQYTQKYRIGSLSLVPPVVVAMAKHPIVKEFDLSSIKSLGSGAAPLGREIIQELESRFPKSQGINLKQGYGMTEATCSMLGWDQDRHCEDSSVGEPNPNIEIAIMPPSSEVDLDHFDPKLELPRHTRGELWARGPNIMKGYWRNPTATASTLTRDGWLKTGDICYVDDRDYVFVVDRLKELIKVKGNQVAPAELEAVLLDHPAVSDAAIIGVPDQIGDEKVRAYVVRQPNGTGKKATGEEIIAWMKERTARHKWITAGVRFVDAIPKNPSGKILRRQIRDMEKAERSKDRSGQGARL